MRHVAVIILLLLAACGADGEPERPERGAQTPGLSITGTASIGITGGS